MKRIRRDRELQAARDQEIMDIERRRQMTDEQVMAENLKNGTTKEKSKVKFLQKYYHKGAFFGDEDLLQRDYTQATLEDQFDKTALPKVMQVKNFGMKGRSKWTHLAGEDTSSRDAGWNKQSQASKHIMTKMGGIKSSFGQPPQKKHKPS